MALSEPVLSGPGAGRTVSYGSGSSAELKLAGEQSGGDWAVVEWRVRAGDLERARELRAIIRALLAKAVDGDPPPTATVRRLNELAALAPITARLRWTSDEPPKAHLSLPGAGRLDALLALLAQSAIDVLGGSGAGRLRRCEAPGCINYYLKDHPRRAWCSPKCGNRVRVARHYQRHRRTGP